MTGLKKEDLMAGLFGIDQSVENEHEPANSTNMELQVDELFPSENNHFRVEVNDDMEELKASIKMNGVFSPLIVRARKDAQGYEIVSGHRRHMAATLAGLKAVPVIVKDLSNEDRDIIIADSNLQRPQILTSEKAWAIRLKYDAIKRKQGHRNNASDKRAPSALLNSAQAIAEEMGLGARTVKNYIRLTYLIDPILNMVDKNKLPLKAGVQLSYLSKQIQQQVFVVMESESLKVNEDLAQRLRENLSNIEIATAEELHSILNCKKMSLPVAEDMAKISGVKINKQVKKVYFPPSYTDEQVYNVLIGMLEIWASANNPDYEGYEQPENKEE